MRGYSSLFEESRQHTSRFGRRSDLGGGSQRLPARERQVVLQVHPGFRAAAAAETPGDIGHLHAELADTRSRNVCLALLLVVEVGQQLADGFDRRAEEPFSGVVSSER